MSIYAIIEDGTVSSLAISDYPLHENWVLTDRTTKVGYGYDGTSFINRDVELKIKRERQWRDAELKSSDWIVSVTDHPQHAEYVVYRQELRDYPNQENFPENSRPILGEPQDLLEPEEVPAS